MRTAIAVIFITCFVSLMQCQNDNQKSNTLIVGTYATVDNEGIYVYDFNSQTGDFMLKSKIAGIENPSYLTISRDGQHVYAANEVKEGTISAFSLNPATGDIKFINRVSSGGSSPCFVTVDDKNRYVFASNYNSGGDLAAIPLKADGSLGEVSQFIHQDGSSINERRQSGPHVHSAFLSPDDRYLITPNLGTDKLGVYKVDVTKNSQPLTPADPNFVGVKPGSGPRHLIFHPSTKYLYVVQEMEGMITAFDYKDGKLVEKQTITMLAPDFEGRVGAADIHVSADGKFLYATNRGDANDIVIYSIDNMGQLTYVGRHETMGEGPRNFVIDPTGDYLLVANQRSNEIIIFKRDQKTGLLTPTGKKIEVSKPVCLKFVGEK